MTDYFTTDPASFEGRMLASPETTAEFKRYVNRTVWAAIALGVVGVISLPVVIPVVAILGVVNAIRK